MIDDNVGNARRNLVVFSFAIITLWWLELPPTYLLNKILGSTYAVETYKPLVLITITQLYLLLRYRFSHEATTEWEKLKAELQSLLREKVTIDLQRRLLNFRKQATKIFEPPLLAFAKAEELDNPFGDGSKLTMVRISLGGLQFENAWSGDLSVESELVGSDNRTAQRSGGNRLKFKYSLLQKILVCIKSTAHVILYTRAAVELIYPLLLGTVAVILTIVALFQTNSTALRFIASLTSM